MLNLVRRTEEFYRILTENPDVLSSDYRQEAYHGFMTMRTKLRTWFDGERKRFVLSKHLIEAFVNTDIPLDLQGSDFKYPFDCFMLEGQIPFFQTTTPLGVFPVSSMLFMTADYIMKDPQVRFCYSDGRVAEKPEWYYAITAFYTCGNAVESLMLNIGRDETIKECADNRRKDPFMLSLEPSDVAGMVNMFFNTLLYIADPRRGNTAEPRVEHVKDSKSGPYRPCPYILLRPPVDYKPIPGGTGKPLDKRFVVRGHWRNQACGESMSQRRMTWIKPFWKGPELAPVVYKPYRVM